MKKWYCASCSESASLCALMSSKSPSLTKYTPGSIWLFSRIKCWPQNTLKASTNSKLWWNGWASIGSECGKSSILTTSWKATVLSENMKLMKVNWIPYLLALSSTSPLMPILGTFDINFIFDVSERMFIKRLVKSFCQIPLHQFSGSTTI